MERAQTKPYFVYMKRFLLFVLFIWFGAGFKFQFSFVIYISYITLCYLAEAFIQKRLTNEDNRSNQNQQKSNNMQVLY